MEFVVGAVAKIGVEDWIKMLEISSFLLYNCFCYRFDTCSSRVREDTAECEQRGATSPIANAVLCHINEIC